MRAKLALVITLLTPSAALRAQAAPAPGTAAAVGTVFDSVRLRPMAGAQIRVDSTSLVATADADGRFRLENIPPGEHYLRVDHPMVDTLGIQLRSGMR